MTQKEVLSRAFIEGLELTSKQIRARFGIACPTKVVSELRMEEGLPIKSYKSVDSKGRVKHKFFLGAASSDIVAAGYRARALGI